MKNQITLHYSLVSTVNYLDVKSTLVFLVKSYGLLGIFLISFIGNAIPYITIPYLVVVMTYVGTVKVNPLVVGIISGIGAALGKVVVYLLGRLAGKFVSEERKEHLIKFVLKFEKEIFLAILILAATPSPDDVIYIPVGASRYPLLKFFIACALGKVVISSLTASFGWFLGSGLELLGIPWYLQFIALLALSLYLLYLALAIKWDLVLSAFEENWIKGLLTLLKEVRSKALPRPRVSR